MATSLENTGKPTLQQLRQRQQQERRRRALQIGREGTQQVGQKKGREEQSRVEEEPTEKRPRDGETSALGASLRSLKMPSVNPTQGTPATTLATQPAIHAQEQAPL